MSFKTRAEDEKRRGGSDVRWKTVTQTSGCVRKRSLSPTVDSGYYVLVISINQCI